jgi:hypothetical protein
MMLHDRVIHATRDKRNPRTRESVAERTKKRNRAQHITELVVLTNDDDILYCCICGKLTLGGMKNKPNEEKEDAF